MSETQKPFWVKKRITYSPSFAAVQHELRSKKLVTVCEEAHCPNQNECWGEGTATFMILGKDCTRGCRFCQVQSVAKPKIPDEKEPQNLGQTIHEMKLDYVVITMVDRDDLADQGVSHILNCLHEVKKQNPTTNVEVLLGDFQGKKELVEQVGMADVVVWGHNMETVKRLQSDVRDRRANYEQSLNVLRWMKELHPSALTKSAIMMGLGETEDEVRECLMDLKNVGVDWVTMGQYLRPSAWHLEVKEYVSPQQFERYEQMANEMGFRIVQSGPFVRSSYRAGEMYQQHQRKQL